MAEVPEWQVPLGGASSWFPFMPQSLSLGWYLSRDHLLLWHALEMVPQQQDAVFALQTAPELVLISPGDGRHLQCSSLQVEH